MKTRTFRASLAPLFLLAACLITRVATGAENTLTPEESKAGWRLLFDGKTLDDWRNYHGSAAGPEWKIVDGAISLALHAKPGEAGQLNGGLITKEEFDDFELSIDWKIAPGANSGIFYHVSETGKLPNETGIEYQILDNQTHPDAKHGTERQAGACYAVYAPSKDATHPVGQWNTTRILVKGNHVEHWLNGIQLLTYELGSENWSRRVANSKFKSNPRYGRVPKGHILLQNHGHHVEFRNIKLRPL